MLRVVSQSPAGLDAHRAIHGRRSIPSDLFPYGVESADALRVEPAREHRLTVNGVQEGGRAQRERGDWRYRATKTSAPPSPPSRSSRSSRPGRVSCESFSAGPPVRPHLIRCSTSGRSAFTDRTRFTPPILGPMQPAQSAARPPAGSADPAPATGGVPSTARGILPWATGGTGPGGRQPCARSAVPDLPLKDATVKECTHPRRASSSAHSLRSIRCGISVV
jgi:hypothetical protein